MTELTSTRRKAIALLEQLPEDQLEQAVTFLEALRHQTTPRDLIAPASEPELLRIIGRRLPADEQARLMVLRQRNEAGLLTEAEHQELLAYVDRVEQQDAERAAALLQLAQLRNVDPKDVIREFLPVHQSA